MVAITLDSSRQSQSITIFDPISFKIISTEYIEQKSSELIQIIQNQFAEQKLQAQDISAIAISIGPGSFTGLRGCIAVAKTIASELKLKIFTVNNFELLRFQYGLSPSQRVAMPAGKNDYFISLDDNYTNLETNFFSPTLVEGLTAIDFQNPNLSLLIKDFWEYKLKQDQEIVLFDHHSVEPYYLREPSIGKISSFIPDAKPTAV